MKGFDPLLNLVLDDCVEYLRGTIFKFYCFFDKTFYLFINKCQFHSPDPEDSYKLTEDVRKLGLVVFRGPTVVVIGPVDGMEQIPNPFLAQ